MNILLHVTSEENLSQASMAQQVYDLRTKTITHPGGTPLYKVYRYVPPQRVWFLSCFGLKMGIDFEHFGLKLGMVIGGTFTKAYKIIFLPSHRGE